MKRFYVTKASGDVQRYLEEKLLRSLRKAGATLPTAREVLHQIEPKLYDGIPTKKLYRLAFQLLKKTDSPIAARYSLKAALMQLGPDGFGFERFVGAILAKEGFRTEYDAILQGRCAWHEIDIVGRKDKQRVLVECKFHNQTGKKCDVKTALYVRARALDLKETVGGEIYSDFRLVTNTKFTSQAESYAVCSGLRLLSWNYPKGEGIKELVLRFHLHPITCLTTLSSIQKRHLLAMKIVLCQEIMENPSALDTLRLSDGLMAKLRSELKQLS